jgi:hypothetical protein
VPEALAEIDAQYIFNMKNLFFSLATVAVLTLSSFTTVSNNFNGSVDDSIVRCRWRSVNTWSDGRVSYTGWTYGFCNKDGGDLTPIR